jgi:hypothetical protein
MRYVCLIYFDPKSVFDGSAESNAVLAAVGPHDDALKAKGQLVFAQALALPAEAMTVQVHEGNISATDGPFIETKEMLGGLTVIEAPDLNAAVQLAAGIPFAQLGSIEVRPVPISRSRARNYDRAGRSYRSGGCLPDRGAPRPRHADPALG